MPEDFGSELSQFMLGGVSNDACEADIIEGGNVKYLKNMPYHCCCFLDEN